MSSAPSPVRRWITNQLSGGVDDLEVNNKLTVPVYESDKEAPENCLFLNEGSFELRFKDIEGNISKPFEEQTVITEGIFPELLG